MNKLYTTTTIVRTKLLESEAIRQYVGEHIFPVVANDGIEGDFIVVRRQSYDRSRTKQGISGNISELSVVIVTEDYNRGVALAKLVDDALDVDCDNDPSQVYQTHGILSVELVGAYEEYDDMKYVQILDFEIQ